jgi:hypothetical protein
MVQNIGVANRNVVFFSTAARPKREQKSTTKEKDVSEEERKNHENSRLTEPYRH